MSGLIGLILGLLWAGSMGLLARRQDPRWRDVAAGGLLALFVAAFFWRTLSGDVFQPADGGDLVSFLFPTYRFAADVIQQGRLPLWNPALYAGAPFISDIQAGFLYPPNLLLFWLNPQFEYVWMQWLSMGHLWWAGLGIYVLARTLGFSPPAALLAGTAFQFSDPLLIHLGNYNLIAVLSWLGWILAALHRTLHSPNGRSGLAWASLTALLFALSAYPGHAQSSYYVGMAVGGYWVGWVILRWTSQDQRMKNQEWARRSLFFILYSLRPMAVIALLTFLLAAPILLPAVEMIPWTGRASFAYQETVGFSLAPLPGIAGLLTPGFFGRGPALHWGLWDRVELPYAGAVTLLLAVAGLSLTRRRADWARLLPWIGLGLFGFGVALGIYAPLHGWLTQILPGYAQFRAPARAIVLFTLSLSILAAAGMDGLLAQAKSAGRGAAPYLAFLRWGGLAQAALLLPVSLGALLLWQEEPTAFLRASVAALAVSWVVAAWLGTWLLTSLWSRGALGRGWFAGLLTGLLLMELAATGAYTDIAEADPAANFHHPEIVQFLAAAPGPPSPVEGIGAAFRIDTRTGIEPFWQPNTAALHWGEAGLEDVWGVANPLFLSHYDRFSERTGGRHTRLYDMLNGAYVIVADGTPLPDKFTPALDAPGPLAVYHNPDALPRAWLATESLTLPDEDAVLSALTGPGFDPLETVLLLPGAQTRLPGPWLRAPLLRLEVTAPEAGHLVLSEVWYPGWWARVNGAEVPVLRANSAFRAVPVPPGRVTVDLYFVPLGWQWGVLLFGLGVVLMMGVWLLPKPVEA